MFEIRLISTRETYPLRIEVLCLPDKPADCVFEYDDAPDTFHLGAFCGEQLVSAASFARRPAPLPQEPAGYQLCGMATRQAYHGQGAGKAVVLRAMEHLHSRGVTLLWCSARKSAMGFYEKLEFHSAEDPHIVAGYGEHVTMYRAL